jgi:UDP-N-acetylglucosamine acyltransferase
VPNIHPTALVCPEAELADDVTIGPFAVIDGPVRLAAGVSIGGHAHITGKTEIGAGTKIGWGSIVGADPQDLHFDPATESGVILGERNVLREYVTIHRGSKAGGFTRMGSGNYLMTGAHLAHDVVMGDDNILANNVLLAGHIVVGNKVFLGGASAFHQFIKIGDLAMVRGLAAVSQDIPPFCMAYGHNLLSGLNVVGLRRAGLDAETRKDIKDVYKLFFMSGKPRPEIVAEFAARTWNPQAAQLIEALLHPSKKGVATP